MNGEWGMKLMDVLGVEMKSLKWLWSGIALQMGTGYVLAFFVYQIGTLISEGTFGTGFVPGLIAVSAMIGVVVYLCVKSGKTMKNVVK